MTGDDIRDALKWSAIAAMIAALWFGVLTVRKARATIAAGIDAGFIETEHARSDDIRPVWVIIAYEVQNEKPVGIIEFVFETYEKCQQSSAEIKKQLGLPQKPACVLRWLKGDEMSEDMVM